MNKLAPDKKQITQFIQGVSTIVNKNTKLLLRTKASTLLIILGPLLLIFFSGIAFDNTNPYSVKIGTYSAQHNTLTKSFIEKLHEKQFKTSNYDSEEECVDSIKEGEVHACIVFAPDFKLASNSNEITFYLDYSKLNLAWSITSIINEQIGSRSKELSANLTTEIIRALDFTKQQINKRKQSVTTLTSQNDEASKKIYEISATLEELELSMDANQLGLTNLTLQKNRIKHWSENSVTLGESATQQALQYVGAVDDLVQASAASQDLKNNIHEYLKTTVNDIGTLKERMTTTKNILGQESEEYDAVMNTIINKISATKTKIDAASSARGLTLQELNTVRTMLDKALISILELQKSLNEMEKTVGAIKVTDPGSIVQPIITTIKPVATEKSYLNYLFPTLIALVIMYTALLLTPILILLERNSPVAFRNFLTPTTDAIFITSTFATSALLLAVQLLIVLTVATIFFSSQILSSLFITLFICLLTIVLFTFAGMIIGYVFNSEETAILASTFLATGALLFSDAILPLESMSPWLGWLGYYNPFVIASTLLRKTIVLNATIGTFWQELMIIIFYCFIAAGITVFVY
ncbi:ABC transporter permease, partial [Candidatus Woesearchaeota archaeon]|nr:ABC transporter permease [Candidatus Woesearchaeota archaeon]